MKLNKFAVNVARKGWQHVGWSRCNEMAPAETRGLKGLGCGLGMSLHIPPPGLHTCSPPPAGEVSFHLRQPPEGCVQRPHPPPHVSGS